MRKNRKKPFFLKLLRNFFAPAPSVPPENAKPPDRPAPVKTPIKIVGLEEAPISDIVLRDIHIQGGKQKCIFEDCERITMDDVIVNGEELKLK